MKKEQLAADIRPAHTAEKDSQAMQSTSALFAPRVLRHSNAPLHPQRFHYNDVLVSLTALMVMPVYLYGMHVVFLALTAVLTAIVTEFICGRLAGKGGIARGDRSCLVTALTVTALMPASAPYWLVMFAVVFGLAVAKHPFGGTGKNIFNPAAAGVAFCAICWPELLTRYPIPAGTLWPDPASIQYGASPASILRVGGTPKIDHFDLMMGKFVGPLGATCMIVLGACLLYLLLRRRLSPLVVFPAFLIVGLAAVFLARTTTGRLNSVVYEFASGALVFGVIFMANDPTTMPDTKAGRLFYGVLIGIITVLIRRFGAMELEIVFVILLANIFAYSCDRYAARLARRWGDLTGGLRKRLAAQRRLAAASKRRSQAEQTVTSHEQRDRKESPPPVRGGKESPPPVRGGKEAGGDA